MEHPADCRINRGGSASCSGCGTVEAHRDSKVEALIKVHEYRHDFLRRPYLKADGLPAQYSPDFLVRTNDTVYVVETKAQSALSDENVKRKQRAAIFWCEQVNELEPEVATTESGTTC